jgi:hypothetical protein
MHNMEERCLYVDATKFDVFMLMPQNSIMYHVVHAKSDRPLHECAKNYRITNDLDTHKDPKTPLFNFGWVKDAKTNMKFYYVG